MSRDSVADNMLALLERKTVTVNDRRWKMVIGQYSGAKLKMGDTYWAGRDVEYILTVRDIIGKYVYAVEADAPVFHFEECVGVEPA